MMQTPWVIVMRPVLEVCASEGFALWLVAFPEPYGFLPLGGALDPVEVGTAVMRIAEYNHIDPEDDGGPAQPIDPLGNFLHGLLTTDQPLAPGGMRVTDTTTGTTLLPGCCSGLEEWRDWFTIIDGCPAVGFGHDPSPLAERLGDTVRLTVGAEQDDSPVVELPVTGLRRSLADAEQDLSGFLRLVAVWTGRCVPDHAAQVTTALAQALDMPVQAMPLKP